MLTDVQLLLINTLSDHLNRHDTNQDDSCDISGLSDAQQVSPIIYYQTGQSALQPAFAAAFYYAVQRKRLLEEIDEKFKSAEIRYLVFKGSEIAQYYPHPYLRTSGDIDILVHIEDKIRASEIFKKMGFKEPESKLSDHEWCYWKDDLEIELHHRLLYNDVFNEDRIIGFTDQVWHYAESVDGIHFRLEPEFHFVFLLIHLRKHFLWSGVGIRQFMDLAAMVKNADLDYERIVQYLNQCKMTAFAAICFGLISRWFKISSPISPGSIRDDFYDSATKNILSGNVFGKMDQETMEINSIVNQMHKNGRLSFAIKLVFPSYEQMKKKYPTVFEDRTYGKIFLPVMWIRRMTEALLKKYAGERIRYVSRFLITGKKEKERREMLQSWGIDLK